MKRLQGGKVIDVDPFEGVVVAEPKTLSVPDGSIQEVLDWVGDDPVRHAAALDAELAKDNPRSTLVDKLS